MKHTLQHVSFFYNNVYKTQKNNLQELGFVKNHSLIPGEIYRQSEVKRKNIVFLLYFTRFFITLPLKTANLLRLGNKNK